MWKTLKAKLLWKGSRWLILQLRYLENPHVSGQVGRGPIKDPQLSEASARDQMCYGGAPSVAITKCIWVPLSKALSQPLLPCWWPLTHAEPCFKGAFLVMDLRGSETLIAVFYLSPSCTAFARWPHTEQNAIISSFPNGPVSILYWPHRNFKDEGEQTPPTHEKASLLGQGEHFNKHLLMSGLQWWNRKPWVARASDPVSLQWIIR